MVKLGTITPTGADVYSYAEDEDDLVSDPHLAAHLAHWGINTQAMSKTEKSMTELQISANESLQLDKITEGGKDLTPLHGPGYVGLHNLGNSCYMNSVVQLLAAMPEFGRYCSAAKDIFRSAPADPTQDAVTQLAKVAEGLLSTRYAAPSEVEPECAVSPRMFKQLFGKGHAEFATARQQDAYEYLSHVLDQLQRAERTSAARMGGEGAAAGSDAAAFSSLFSFQQEERIEAGGQVAYRTVGGVRALPLSVPLEAATNKAAVDAYTERAEKRQKTTEGAEADKEEPVVPLVPFEACLSQLAAAETLESFRGHAAASKTVRFKTFPRYLVVHMQRYVQKPDWTIGKLSVEVPAPETLDLSALRATGLQPGETAMAEEAAAPAAAAAAAAAPAAAPAAATEPDEGILAQLISMGFSENGSKRAAIAVKNSSGEAAMEWVFAHMEDPDFNDPLPPPGAPEPAAGGGGGGGGGEPAAADAGSIEMLSAMGFTATQASGALAATQGNVERAADWLMSHMDDLDAAVAEALGGGGGGGGGGAGGGGGGGDAEECDDGPGAYELLGFISHMGSNTACGHYVCHIKKEGRWVLFNDAKVAASESTPLHLGYIYFYKRKD